MLRYAASFALLSSLSFVSAPGLAHTFSAPSQVRAAADGSFRYDAVLAVGPGSATASSSSWRAQLNVTPLGVIGDGDCEFTIPAGGTDLVHVDGTLVDPTRPGQVRAGYGLCTPQGTQFLFALTDILPAAAPVPVFTPGATSLLGLALALLGMGLSAPSFGGHSWRARWRTARAQDLIDGPSLAWGKRALSGRARRVARCAS